MQPITLTDWWPVPQNGGSTNNKFTVPYYWRGGTIGAEHDWQQPLNWHNGCVPGWTDKVVIPGQTTACPSINCFVNDIAELVIMRGARLLICETGRLTVDGFFKKEVGILNNGELIVEGELTICRNQFCNIENAGILRNHGSIAFDMSEEIGLPQMAGGGCTGKGEWLFLGQGG